MLQCHQPNTLNRIPVITFFQTTTHYSDVIMGTMPSRITSLTTVYSTVYSGADQTKDLSSASLAFVWGVHQWPVNSPHKWPLTRKMFPFDYVIMVFRARICELNFVHFCFDCLMERVLLEINETIAVFDIACRQIYFYQLKNLNMRKGF